MLIIRGQMTITAIARGNEFVAQLKKREQEY